MNASYNAPNAGDPIDASTFRKRANRRFLAWITMVLPALLLGACLFIEVEQPETATQGEVITINISVVDSVSDDNPWRGILSVMVPEDWEFVSATYSGDLGSGDLILDQAWADSTEIIRPADEGMKWIGMISDEAYSYTAPIFVDASVQLKVGQTTGAFDLGYFTTKNAFSTADVHGFWEHGSADTLFNQTITVLDAVAIEDVLKDGVPSRYVLEQNYPNPFNPSTAIRYALSEHADVRLSVFDVAGREVMTFYEGVRAPGVHEVLFTAENLPSGLFLYRLEIDGAIVETRSMILAK